MGPGYQKAKNTIGPDLKSGRNNWESLSSFTYSFATCRDMTLFP
jgi:hypothetical protein